MKHRTPRSILILLAVLLLAVSLLASACRNGVTRASQDGTTEAPGETTDNDPKTTEAPTNEVTTAPTEETVPPTSAPDAPPEKETTAPPDHESEPSSKNEEPATFAPRDPKDVVINTVNPEGLSEEKLALLRRYLTDLAVVQDASELDYVTDEIRAEWDYLPYAELKYTCNIVWDEENEFVLSCYRRSGKTVGDGLRYHLIVFRIDEGKWTVSEDVHSDLWMMSDVSEETQEILAEVFRKAREARPVTEEEIENARAAALDAIVDWGGYGWPDGMKNNYRKYQEIFYYPKWSDENLPLVLSWTYDYRLPALLFIDRNTVGFEQTVIVFASLENGEWVVRYLGTRYQPEPPAEYPGVRPN